MSLIRLGPSRLAAFETCPRKYAWEYVWRWEPKQTSANLVFGSAIHTAVESNLRASIAGRPNDPVATFSKEWLMATQSQAIEYSSMWKPTELEETGQVLMSRFEESFAKTEMFPAFDRHGEPMIERALEVKIGRNILLPIRLDLGALNASNELIIVDHKTPAAACDEGYAEQSDQGTTYQIVVDAHAEQLGLPGVSGFAFFEGIKKKVAKTTRGEGPTWHLGEVSKRRSAGEVQEFIKKLRWVADDIEKQRFPKRPGLAFSSPCGLCAYRDACHKQNMDGLRKKPIRSSSPIQQGAAAATLAGAA